MRTYDYRLFSVALIATALTLAAFPAAATAQEDTRAVRVYTPKFLHPDNAAALALQVCGSDNRCSIESMGNQGIVLRTTPEIHAEYAALLTSRDVPPPTQEFRVILLRANRSGAMPDVPADAHDALEDLRDILSYTGFEMIDSAWLRTSRSGSTSLGEAGSFRVELSFVGNPSQDDALLMEAFQLSHSRVDYYEDDEGQRRPVLGDSRYVLGSEFGINVGETVVVGTSRLNGGDEALVVLLTALPR